MKKTIALLLVVAMCFALAACSGAETAVPEEETAGQAALPAETWVNLYSGASLTLNSDGTLMLGESSGTWSLDGSLMTIKYSTASGEIERNFDLTEENDAPLLRGHTSAIVNGSNNNMAVTDFYPSDRIDVVKAAVAKKSGDVVSSDIVELTINDAALAYYATGASTGSDGKTSNVDEANSPAESGGLFTAAKGRCLTCIDFTIKNTDRSSLNTDDAIIRFSVVQNGNYGNVRGYDLNNDDGIYSLNMWNAPIAYDGGDFYTNDTSNKIINAGQTARIKFVGVAGFEADLNVPFDLIVYLMNSSGGTETFVYTFGG